MKGYGTAMAPVMSLRPEPIPRSAPPEIGQPAAMHVPHNRRVAVFDAVAGMDFAVHQDKRKVVGTRTLGFVVWMI